MLKPLQRIPNLYTDKVTTRLEIYEIYKSYVLYSLHFAVLCNTD